MSLFEILVILIVALLVIKPEDIPKLIKKFKKTRTFVTNTKKDVLNYFDPDKKKLPSNDLEGQMEQMNFYLEKISDLDSEYTGDYSLDSVKEHYRKAMNKKISSKIKK